ncbi:hypothetical protein KO516_05175 [Citreicella sp. C3M06]|uniref:hypothetical protein n=1 Tax=Citreicella sp. C3M06 TaxID=2841564 RepID=UPI001C0864B7|nr:hypothetical protein [Citreicella sp. C3M06]MBU2960229.1 hypothetical protein [Citreicella sp. C3M06]
MQERTPIASKGEQPILPDGAAISQISGKRAGVIYDMDASWSGGTRALDLVQAD